MHFKRCLAGIFALVVSTAGIASAQVVTQSFTLHSGWNAIWLEIEPTNNAIGAVFTNVPVVSVWTHLTPRSTVQFITNQTEQTLRQEGWLGYFPPQREESLFNNLFAVSAWRAYLVNLGTNAGATLTVRGTPVVKSVAWEPDAFNLRGFPVSPAAPPTFNTFFSPSAAHAGQAVYRLSANGSNWVLAAGGDVMKNGEACWVYCQGNSTYQAPTGLELEDGVTLDFARTLTTISTRLRNNTTAAGTVTVRDLVSGAGGPLSYLDVSVAGTFNWLPMPALALPAQAGDVKDLRLTVRRRDMAVTNHQTVLEVTDALGTYYRLGVTARKATLAAGALANAGLWAGTATITNVSEMHSINPTNLTPVKSSFELRLLVHVDTNGTARLLKEVIQMWRDGTYTNDAQGRKVVATPGRYVLLTDDSLLATFAGATLRDGTAVGRRLSTVDFDFPPYQGTNNFLPLTGAFAINSAVNGSITVDPDFATNPFRHKYHPDHDNLDARFTSAKAEVYQIRRSFTLTFTSAAPTDEVGGRGSDAQDYGYSTLGGTYFETVQGLHRNSIAAGGFFRLQRVAETGVLNR
jgi:hypothetical protein